MNSTRLAEKITYKACGKTLLELMIERLKPVQVDVLLVATTINKKDDYLVALCNSLNIPCFRGSEEDVLDRYYKAALANSLEVVIRIPSDCPLIDPAIVSEMLSEFLNKKDEIDYMSNLHPCTTPDGLDVEIMTFEALKIAWREADKLFQREHVTPYLWDNPQRFKISNWRLPGGNEEWYYTERWTIDYKEDVEMVIRIFEELYPKKGIFSWKNVFCLLNDNPEIRNINSHLAGINWYRNCAKDLRNIDKQRIKYHPSEKNKEGL